MSVKVKICGITNLDDTFWAASLGANFLGFNFNFYKFSKRNISVDTVTENIKKSPEFVEPAAVFVDEPFKEILKVVEKCRFSSSKIYFLSFSEDHFNEST